MKWDEQNTTNAVFAIPESTEEAIQCVVNERQAQDAKWGQQDHSPVEWISVLTEEVGEAAEHANLCNWHPTTAMFANLRDELVQVAAVAIAAIESLDRNELA